MITKIFQLLKFTITKYFQSKKISDYLLIQHVNSYFDESHINFKNDYEENYLLNIHKIILETNNTLLIKIIKKIHSFTHKPKLVSINKNDLTINENNLEEVLYYGNSTVFKKCLNKILSNIFLEYNQKTTFLQQIIVLQLLNKILKPYEVEQWMENLLVQNGEHFKYFCNQIYFESLIKNNKQHFDSFYFSKIIFKKDTPNFINLISFLLFKNNKLYYCSNLSLDDRLEEVITNLSDFASENNFDIYNLVKIGKKYLKNFLIKKHINDVLIKKIIYDNCLFSLLNKYHNLKLNIYLYADYELLFYIYIGYAIVKKHYNILDQSLSSIIKIDSKTKNDFFDQNNISENYKEFYYEFFGELDNFKSNKFIEYTNIVDFQDKEKELENKIKESSLREWFEHKVDQYKIENKIKNKNSLSYSVGYKLKALLFTFFKNRDNVQKDKLFYFIELFLMYEDQYKCKNLQRKNISLIDKNELKEMEKKNHIESLYDKKIAKENVITLFSRFTKNIDAVDEICFVENSLLSVIDKFKFSYYEFMGDVIYQCVINDLRLNCIIDNIVDVFSLNIQENISSSLQFEKYIQRKDISNRKLIYRNSSTADFFEVFIYFLYKAEGYQKVKEIILNLIKTNLPKIIIDSDIDEYYKDVEKNKKFNSFFPIKPRFIYYINKKNTNRHKENKITKKENIDIIKKLIKPFIKLSILECQEEFRNDIEWNYFNSYSAEIDLEVNSILDYLKYIIENIEESEIFYELAKLLEKDFSEFWDLIVQFPKEILKFKKFK